MRSKRRLAVNTLRRGRRPRRPVRLGPCGPGRPALRRQNAILWWIPCVGGDDLGAPSVSAPAGWVVPPYGVKTPSCGEYPA